MGIAFKQFFASITVLFVAFAKLAGALNFMSAWAEETAGSFYDEARHDRMAKRREQEQLGIVIEQSTLTQPVKHKAIAKAA